MQQQLPLWFTSCSVMGEWQSEKATHKKIYIFTQKSELFGHHNKHDIWSKPNAAQHPKHTIHTSIMLWGCFSTACPEKLVKGGGEINAAKVGEILKENMM